MTSHERLETVFKGERPDRTPLLGGWIANPDAIAAIAGVSRDQYWADPMETSIRAYERLGMDGLIDVFVPVRRDDFRFVDAQTYQRADRGLSVEDLAEQVDAMPSPEKIESDFDFEAKYDAFRQELIAGRAKCRGMVWMPAQWDAGARANWYNEFGYETYFLLIALYPDRARKLMEIGGATGRCWSRMIARAVAEGLYPHAVLLGEDLCTQRGPMLSPDFLERYYAPQLRYGLEPLRQVGCKPVWHCDGNVRPILDLVLECGVQGLQGFQPECGMDIEWIVDQRTRDGKPLLIFGPLSVTTELPVLRPDQVRRRVRRAVELCRGKADLVLFTANTINPDVPLENIMALYEAVTE